MNFMTEGIGTTINANTVECDGHEAKNLLSTELGLHSSSGFLAESFVRPPVTLSIKFPLCIEVSHIVINPKLGKQITSAILIHTETSYRSWTKENNGPISSHLVAKEFINTSPIPNVIVFRNPRFVLRRPFSSLPLEHYQRYRNHDVIYNLKHPSFNANQRVVGMEISILRVAGSSVPALGGLQVWGQPCIRCGQDEVNKLYKQWSRILRRGDSFLTPQVHSSTDSSDEEAPSAKKSKLSNQGAPNPPLTVPDDFLDAITYEIMCQPIRLPCGLAVDALTLEKYYAEEAKFGRLPNDPFTGITFNDTFKPLSDAALKSRISTFLTQNQNEPSLADLPRSLGGIVGSGLIRDHHHHHLSYYQHHHFRNPNYYNPRIPNPNSVSTMKSSSCTVTNNFYHHDDADEYQESGFSSSIITSSHHSVQMKPAKPASSTIHQRDMSSDDHMNYELLKMLSEGSSYLAKAGNKPTKLKMERNCKDCGLVMNMTRGISSFYIGLCDHVILCKICLSKTDKQARKTCSQCGVEWRAKDCLRIFI